MFLDKIITLTDIDNSGSDSYNRFEYQVACIFMTFLTLYKKTKNFYILLDYIDDFVVVNNHEQSDEMISFIQVKSKKSRAITISTVIKEHWILKQAKNYEKFIDYNVKNILMTNLGISIKSKIFDDINIISLNDIKEGADDLKKQILDNTKIKKIDDFYIVRSILSLENFEQEIKGIMHNYIIDNSMSQLSAEAIETIYQKIWIDLNNRQRCVLTDEEKNNSDIVIEKKAVKYTRIQEIFKATLDIQIPETGIISKFFNENQLFIGMLDSFEFAKLFKSFRVDSVKMGIQVLETVNKILNENEFKFVDLTDTFNVSKQIIDVLDSDEIISSTEFYKKYKYCIGVLFTYKMLEF